MSAAQLIVHYIFASLLSVTTFCRLVQVDKKRTHYLVRYALTLLGISCVICLLVPIYIIGTPYNNYSPLTWAFIFLEAAGAIVQTVFGVFWQTGMAQKVYQQTDVQVKLTDTFSVKPIFNEEKHS